MKEKRKVGLALGGGGAHGFAHIGVLEALHEEAVPISMIAGTSAGAAIGAIYCQMSRFLGITTLRLFPQA
jgi:NTE family protein